MKKQYRFRLAVLGAFLVSLFFAHNALGSVANVNSIADKSVGDSVFHSEFNSILNTLRNIFNQDTGTNIGIGATPHTTLKLDVDGKVGATEYCNEDGSVCQTANNLGGGKFVDGDTATDAVFTTGNVGIGTTNPASKLSVVGLPSGATDAATGGNLAGALCITDTGNLYIDTDGTCAN